MQKNTPHKIKVVFAINDFLVGGAQKLHLDLFTFFDQSHFELHLVTLFQFPQKKDFFHLVPSHVVVHKMNFKNSRDLKAWAKLFFALKEIAPDVLVSSLFFTNTVCRVLAVFLGYRVISTEHNTYIHKTPFEILVDRWLSHRTFKIIAVSKTVADFTARQEKIPRDTFVVIQNGIDLEKIHAEIARGAAGTELGLPFSLAPGDKCVINVGRLTAQKNHMLMIEAFELFAKRHEEYRLIILGEGSLRASLQAEIVKRGLEQKIFLLGSHEKIIPYYLMSEMFVSTSVIEGFGIAHAEALACGLPVVTTKTAGPDEMIREGENGYFVESSAASVAAGMEQVIAHNLAARRESIAASVEAFSIRTTVEKYGSLITAAVSGTH